jgi:integrase
MLSKRAIARLAAPTASGKQTLYWDTELTGFGVSCSGKSGSKSYVVQRDLAHGRTRRITVAPCNVLTLDAARKQAEGILAQFYAGHDPKAARRGTATLKQVLADYLMARKDLRDKSRRMYTWAITQHLAPWLDRPLAEITPEMVETQHRVIAATVSRSSKNDGKLAANTAMVTLRLLWNFQAERVGMPRNPVRILKRQWYPEQRRTRHVRAGQLAAFWAALQTVQNAIAKDYITLLLFTGMRAGEAASLRWEDIDFHNNSIHVPGARTKSGEALDLSMVDIVRDVLVARRQLGRTEFVFPGNGRTKHIREARHSFGLIAQVTGSWVAHHDLRRTYASVAESCDISGFALKALLNHSLGGGITESYIMVGVERLREPAQRVADRLKQLAGIAPVAGGNVEALRR